MEISRQRSTKPIADAREQQRPKGGRDTIQQQKTGLPDVGCPDRDRADRAKPVEETKPQDEGDRMTLKPIEGFVRYGFFENALDPSIVAKVPSEQEEALVGDTRSRRRRDRDAWQPEQMLMRENAAGDDGGFAFKAGPDKDGRQSKPDDESLDRHLVILS